MNVLIVAATETEIKPVSEYLSKNNFCLNDTHFEILISGVGSIATVYMLTKKINMKAPDLLIQAGIAGCFNNLYKLCEVVAINGEIMADSGAEESSYFKDIFDLGLIKENDPPFNTSMLINPHKHLLRDFGLPLVIGVTVNEITTRKERIDLLQDKYGAETESMEGAAFHYVCLMENIPFIQLRAISNSIGERDKMKWKMRQAIDNLNMELIKWINNQNG